MVRRVLEALVLLATLAYFDLSLILLRIAGTLDPAKPHNLILAGLFLVAGPGSWAAAAAARTRPLRLLRSLAPLGVLAVLYASILSSILETSLSPPSNGIRVAVLPAALAIAAIGLLEIAVREEAREALERFYRRGTGGLPPYTTLMITSLSLLYAAVLKTMYILPSILAYTASLAAYARCARVTRAAAHLGTAGIVAISTLLLAHAMSLEPLAAGLAAVFASAPHVAPLLARAKRVPHGGGCALYPVMGLAAAIVLQSLLQGAGVEPQTLIENIEVFALVGLIGWSSIIGVAAFVDKSRWIYTIVESSEMRVASGLALTLISFEAIGVTSELLAPTVMLAGLAVATLNNYLGLEERRQGQAKVS